MAGRGPAPGAGKKPAGQRRRRNAEPERASIRGDGRVRGPRLPTDVLDEPWHPRTKAWWDTWRRSPMAKSFIATDWDFLLDTALMHHTMWSKQRWEFAAELRLRAAKFGATPEDRLRLKVEIAPAEPKAAPARPAKLPEDVTDIRSRRSRLTS